MINKEFDLIVFGATSFVGKILCNYVTLLHKLEKQGLLLSSWETVQAEGNEDGRGRKRKWYRLSAKGRRRLEQRAAAHRAYQAVVESFLPRAKEEAG